MSKDLTVTHLPSRFQLYPFQSIEMKLFTGKQLSLLSKAATTDTYSPIHLALQETCNQDISNITIGDFYYLASVQRISIPNNPLTVVWTCESTIYTVEDTEYTLQELADLHESGKFGDDTEVLEKECGQLNVKTVNIDDISVLPLENIEKLDNRLDIPRINLIDSITEEMQKDNRLLVPAASFIKDGETLQDKINILIEDESLELYTLASNAAVEYVHGVSTRIKKYCSRCASPSYIPYVFSPNIFFWA